jgi:hypothetical protein
VRKGMRRKRWVEGDKGGKGGRGRECEVEVV